MEGLVLEARVGMSQQKRQWSASGWGMLSAVPIRSRLVRRLSAVETTARSQHQQRHSFTHSISSRRARLCTQHHSYLELIEACNNKNAILEEFKMYHIF